MKFNCWNDQIYNNELTDLNSTILFNTSSINYNQTEFLKKFTELCPRLYLGTSLFLFTHKKMFLFFFWLSHIVYQILVPQPGIKPMPLAVEALSPNHWMAREFPRCSLLRVQFNVLCGQRRDIIGLLVTVELAKELLIITIQCNTLTMFNRF